MSQLQLLLHLLCDCGAMAGAVSSGVGRIFFLDTNFFSDL